MALGGPAGDLVASGSGDGAIAVWEDCTAADADEAAAAAAAAALKEQDLANALQVGPRSSGGPSWQRLLWERRGLGHPAPAAASSAVARALDNTCLRSCSLLAAVM